METFPWLQFVAFLALCTMPTAFSLQCYECTNPGLPRVTRCDSDNITNISCSPIYDRCMTVQYTMSLGPETDTLSVEIRSCSASVACDDPQSDNYTCTVVNKSGMADNCKLACCQEDLCNNGAGPSSKTVEESTPVADQNCNTTLTSAVHGLAASFGAIFSAFHVVLTVFVVFN